MKTDINCDIIKDLLPLYAENMLSADSRALVEAHTADCADCRAALAAMSAAAPVPAGCDAAPIRRVGRAIRRRRILAAALAAAVTLAALTLVIAWLTTPQYLPYSESVIECSEIDGGAAVVVSFPVGEATGYEVDKIDGAVLFTAYRTDWDVMFGNDRPLSAVLTAPSAVCYAAFDGTNVVTVWGEDPNPSGAVELLPRLSLGYYFLLALVATVAAAIAFIALMKRPSARRVALYLGVAPALFAASCLLVTRFSLVTYSLIHDFFSALLLAALMYAAFLIAAAVVRGRRAESI